MGTICEVFPRCLDSKVGCRRWFGQPGAPFLPLEYALLNSSVPNSHFTVALFHSGEVLLIINRQHAFSFTVTKAGCECFVGLFFLKRSICGVE